MDSKALFLVLALSVLLVVPSVLAAVPGGASVQSTEDKGEFPAPSPGGVAVEAGNITLVNVTTKQSTYHWAGIYGNATGKLVLGDSNQNIMYEWDAIAKYVYFDDDQTINWGSLTLVTCTDMESVYGFLSGVSDSCSNTFTTTKDFDSDATGDVVTGAIAAVTYDNTGSPTWYTIAVGDGGTGDIVFIAETTGATYGTAYNGDTVNYQAILPEDGSNGDTNPTTYWIWIELY